MPPCRSPAKRCGSSKYHIWAIDDQLHIRRTTDFQMAVDPETSCPNPVIDRDPERTSNLTVSATIRQQGRKLDDFLSAGVDFHHVKKR